MPWFQLSRSDAVQRLRILPLTLGGLRPLRNVATELFLSPKTVEANLSRIYHKLGIRSRAELGERMGHPDA